MNEMNHNTIENQDAIESVSNTAGSWDKLAESVELYGGSQIRVIDADPEDMPLPPQGDTEITIGKMLDQLEELAAGTLLADEIGDLVGSFATSIHYRLQRVIRQHEQDCDEIQSLAEAADGSEIGDLELQRATKRGHLSGNRLEMLETLRDVFIANAEGRYDVRWTPPKGSYTSRNRKLTHAIIEANDFLAASSAKKRDAMLPQGTRIGFTGGMKYQDAKTIWAYLDRQRERFPDMVLVTTGMARGGDHIAGLWARERGVTVIRCTLNRSHGNRAAFERNEQMMKIGLHALVITPSETGGSDTNGITQNLVGLARDKHRVHVCRCGFPKPKEQASDMADAAEAPAAE